MMEKSRYMNPTPTTRFKRAPSRGLRERSRWVRIRVKSISYLSYIRKAKDHSSVAGFVLGMQKVAGLNPQHFPLKVLGQKAK